MSSQDSPADEALAHMEAVLPEELRVRVEAYWDRVIAEAFAEVVPVVRPVAAGGEVRRARRRVRRVLRLVAAELPGGRAGRGSGAVA